MTRPAVLAREGATTSAVYAAMFLAFGAHLPFWPLWLEDWGLGAAEIGAYGAAGMAVRVVAGMIAPMLADRLDARRLTFSLLAGTGALLFVLHLWIEDRAVLFLATVATAAAFAGMMPIADALGLAAARHFRFEYAHARSVGSAAFLVANIGCGALIAALGIGLTLWWIVANLALAAWLCLAHPGGGKVVTRERATMRDIGRLLGNPVFLIFVGAIAFSQSSHAVLYVYGSVHWRAQGLSDGIIGALWAAGVAAEILLMAFAGPRLIRRIGPVGAISAAGVVGIVRWSAMAMDPGLGALWFWQATHAVTFAAAHLGAMAFLGAATPARLTGTAQGFFGAAAGGVLTAAAMALAALVYPSAGGGAYWIGAAMAAVGLGFTLWLARRWRGGELSL